MSDSPNLSTESAVQDEGHAATQSTMQAGQGLATADSVDCYDDVPASMDDYTRLRDEFRIDDVVDTIEHDDRTYDDSDVGDRDDTLESLADDDRNEEFERDQTQGNHQTVASAKLNTALHEQSRAQRIYHSMTGRGPAESADAEMACASPGNWQHSLHVPGWHFRRAKGGEGGQGRIYFARPFIGPAAGFSQRERMRTYVVKLAKATARDERRKQWQEQDEVRRLRLSSGHPNLVRIEGIMPNPDRRYCHQGAYLLEYCSAGSLEVVQYRFQHAENAIPEAFLWHLFDGLIAAIRFLHWGPSLVDDGQWRPIVHRDLRPANIFLNYNPRALFEVEIKLGDFDSARTWMGIDSRAWAGVAAYQPPEKPTSAPTVDIYAIGATIHDLLHNRAPGDPLTGEDIGTREEERNRAIRIQPVPKDYSVDLQDLLDRLLNPDASRRVSLADLARRPPSRPKLRVSKFARGFLHITRLYDDEFYPQVDPRRRGDYRTDFISPPPISPAEAQRYSARPMSESPDTDDANTYLMFERFSPVAVYADSAPIQQNNREVFSPAPPTYSLLTERANTNNGIEAIEQAVQHDEPCELALDDTSSIASTHHSSHQVPPPAALAPLVNPRPARQVTSPRLSQDDAPQQPVVLAPALATELVDPPAFAAALASLTAPAPIAVPRTNAIPAPAVTPAPGAAPIQNMEAAAASRPEDAGPRRSIRIRERIKRQREDAQIAENRNMKRMKRSNRKT